MCGIAGFVGAGDLQTLERMTATLADRGPDGAGHYVDEDNGIHLGHRRLSILDVAGGAQPMWNEDASVCVVFNGEIYNHAELRIELERCGHRFRTDHSDTEVLVHGFEQWGDELPAKLNGMFAFAIYDRPRKLLFFARDRFGKKPLYYFDPKPGFFAFASELTALRQHPLAQTGIDRLSLQKYLAYGFIPAPRALYAGVRKLPGGYWLRYELASSAAVMRPYWRFEIESSEEFDRRPEEDLAEELRELLKQAVRRRLISDVPLGFFLSGGIDSSAVVAAAAQFMPTHDMKTFAIGFLEPSFDESQYARMVAAHFDTDHRVETISIDAARDLAREVLARLDEPMGDSSILPTFLLCRFARRYVTVALGGDGGDELFGGYDPFRALAPACVYRRWVPHWGDAALRRLVDLLPPSDRNMSLDFKLKRTLRGLRYDPGLWNPVWMSPLTAAEISALLGSPVSNETLYEEALEAWAGSRAPGAFDRSLEYFTRFYLQDDILTKVDRASMMNSLEVRAPFLDNDVVAFARRLPARFKLRRGQSKYLLKRAFRGLLPRAIADRPKKGFGIPLTAWLRSWPKPEPIGGMPPHDAAWTDRVWREHAARKSDHRLFMWCWLVLHHHCARVAA